MNINCIWQLSLCHTYSLPSLIITLPDYYMQKLNMTLGDIHKLAEAPDSTPMSAVPMSDHIKGISFLSSCPKGKCTDIVLC